jgi:hypothetical protein
MTRGGRRTSYAARGASRPDCLPRNGTARSASLAPAPARSTRNRLASTTVLVH